MKRPFQVGDRVRVYGFIQKMYGDAVATNGGAFTVSAEGGLFLLEDHRGDIYYAHPKQCRRKVHQSSKSELKELDRLRAENKSEFARGMKLCDDLERCYQEINSLKELLRRAEEAMKKLRIETGLGDHLEFNDSGELAAALAVTLNAYGELSRCHDYQANPLDERAIVATSKVAQLIRQHKKWEENK